MKFNRIVRYSALTAILLAALCLSSCVSNPDDAGNKNSGGQASNLPPFPIMSPDATATEAPSSTIQSVVTPEPSASAGTPVLPWGATNVPGPFVSPTSSAFTIVTQMPTNTPSPTATVYVLKLGSKGQDVRKLQQRLRELGYYTGSADGDFGKATETAVKNFQSRNGLTADGKVGKATFNKIYAANAKKIQPTAKPTPKATATPKINENVYLKRGDTGSEVTRMQTRLIALGYLTGKATGTFDSATEKAVYAFQKRNVSYSDGIAGPMTLKALYSSNARATSTSSGVVGTSLRKGMTDSASVRNMQSRLNRLGYYYGTIDGNFGQGTEAAVKAFQANNGLVADGVAGESTLNKLYSDGARSANTSSATQKPGTVTPIPKATPIVNYINVTPAPSGEYVTLREGNSGTLVRNLQQALRDQGYLFTAVDGKYGAGTVDAVTRFQRNKGLSQDGVAGPATQRVLFEGNYPAGS